ncbi:hypothetical protein [Limnohabitans sp.]|uniref:hypothetical protein n=1 Tax=Limnohabitans sp. TaxID=1907725 RepID=UPI0025C4D602|nr:hypothetical protein [Limnohabitans sp.]
MSLPSKAIDRLFDRLTATYGNEWINRWQGLDGQAVKSLWAHELSAYTNRLEALAWALENLPPRAPNVIEFKNLCRQAPAPEVPQLPQPKADPERLKQELSKLGEIRAKAVASTTVDHKAWARRIVGRFDAGDKVNPTTLRFAREALRIHLAPEGEV